MKTVFYNTNGVSSSTTDGGMHSFIMTRRQYTDISNIIPFVLDVTKDIDFSNAV